MSKYVPNLHYFFYISDIIPQEFHLLLFYKELHTLVILHHNYTAKRKNYYDQIHS
uniref:Uncharacterized protein n=1 Tax=Rhizophagus irregularis (strain DAOM 181602 / DAOM 197198 / MUCL 43194) TaxID=747089 RepID=U9TVS7_RHIID